MVILQFATVTIFKNNFRFLYTPIAQNVPRETPRYTNSGRREDYGMLKFKYTYTRKLPEGIFQDIECSKSSRIWELLIFCDLASHDLIIDYAQDSLNQNTRSQISKNG